MGVGFFWRSQDGMGNLRVMTGGIQVSGQAYILGSLVATRIRSRAGQHMAFRSSHNITLSTTTDRHTSNTLSLGKSPSLSSLKRHHLESLFEELSYAEE